MIALKSSCMKSDSDHKKEWPVFYFSVYFRLYYYITIYLIWLQWKITIMDCDFVRVSNEFTNIWRTFIHFSFDRFHPLWMNKYQSICPSTKIHFKNRSIQNKWHVTNNLCWKWISLQKPRRDTSVFMCQTQGIKGSLSDTGIFPLL